MSSPTAFSTLPTIYQTYSNKHLFITGGSGFLGKVLLYKILKEFPDVGSVTLLMRGKKGKQSLERLEGDVLSSACFDGLKEQLGPQEWKRRVSKLRVATGDVMNDQLGLSQDDMKYLTQHTNIILHLAATVNFQEKLPVSVQMNVLGSLRVLALARKCPNLEAMIHTSTCYVNYSRHGKALVKEQIYPLPFDPEHMCRLILGMHEKEVPRQTEMLLKKYGFPNTYTFTKNMGEMLLQRMKGSIPLTIVRPSIVGCSLREPYPGWVDVLTAAGGILLTVGLGVTHELHANANNVADVVPVDYVVNTILKAAYKTAVQFKFGTLKLAPVVEATNTSASAAATASAAVSPSPLVENNLRRVTSGAGADSGKSSSLVAVAGGSSASRQQQHLPHHSHHYSAQDATIDSLKVSTSAESTSGMIRPQSGHKDPPGAASANRSSEKAAIKQQLEGGVAKSDAASSDSSDSNATTSAGNANNNNNNGGGGSGNGRLPLVFQSATSGSLTPLTWRVCRESVCEYYLRYPAPRTIDRPHVAMIESRAAFEAAFFLRRKLPFLALQTAAKVPGLMSEKQRGLVAKYARVLHRVTDLNFQFRPFTTVEWRYDSKNSYKYLDDGMDSKTRFAFSTDLYDIDWRVYCENYAFGLVRYFMKVKDSRPTPTTPGSTSDKFMRSML